MDPFLNQPEEITRIQALNLPIQDLDRLSRVDSRFRRLIKNEAFWKAKYQHDYQAIGNPWEELTRRQAEIQGVEKSLLSSEQIISNVLRNRIREFASQNKLVLAMALASTIWDLGYLIPILEGYLNSSRKTEQGIRGLTFYIFARDQDEYDPEEVEISDLLPLLTGPGTDREKLIVLDQMLSIDGSFYDLIDNLADDESLSPSLRKGITRILKHYGDDDLD